VNQRASGSLAVIGAAVLFGTSATSRALADLDIDSTVVAAIRLLIGGGGLALLALHRFGWQMLVALWRRPVVLLMGTAVAGYQALFFIGTGRTGVAVGTLVSLALAPFAAGILGWLLGAGAPGRIWAVSTTLAVIGVGMLTELGGGGVIDPVGVAAALGAGGCYAVYTVIGGRIVREGFPSGAVLGASFAVGGLLLTPWLGGTGVSEFLTPRGLALALWLGIAATTVAYLLFGVGISRLAPGSVATLNLFEPVVAALFGVLLLNEAIAGIGLVGCALIVAALATLGIAESRTPRTPDTAGVGASTP
jgi:drug/metabolite transporter, DME family